MHLRRVCWIAALALIAGAAVSAQVQTNQFVPLAQAAKQTEVPSAPLLYGAYAFVWGALVVYLFTIWRRIARVETELRVVSGKLTGKR